jgi:selenium donor protein
VEANAIISELETVACSPGAACHSDKVMMSHVLEAMGVPVEYAMGTIRFSVGAMTTDAEIEKAAETIIATIKRLTPSGDQVELPAETDEEIRLTKYTHGLGCACKLRPQALERILQSLPKLDNENVLVGTDSADDAAVYRLRDDLVIVQTVDFFTPIVDDPYHFGAIAAANALSDIYAMGAKPLFALNIVGFPSNRLPMSVLQRILQGAQDKAKEAGIVIIGGHTVDDTEPKFGLAVTGVVHPTKVLRNDTARVGDKLILTKPIGLGIVATALKRRVAGEEVTQRAIEIMSTLNSAAADVMANFDVSACTDVTGFGLLGHLREMTIGSDVDAAIIASQTPIIEAALEFIQAGIIPGGTENNLDYVSASVKWDSSISRNQKYLLADAQTSGGLLIAVDASQAEKLLAELHAAGVSDAAIIGEISNEGSGIISVA